MSWIENYKLNFQYGTTPFNKVQECFAVESLSNGTPYKLLEEKNFHQFKKGKNKKLFLKEIYEKIGDKLNSISNKNPDKILTLYNEEFYLHISFNNNKVSDIRYSVDDVLYDIVKGIFDTYINFKDKQNSRVYMLINSSDGLVAEYMGSFKKGLNKNNYSENVIKAYSNCIREIKKSKPRGRLSIFYGPPGT